MVNFDSCIEMSNQFDALDKITNSLYAQIVEATISLAFEIAFRANVSLSLVPGR